MPKNRHSSTTSRRSPHDLPSTSPSLGRLASHPQDGAKFSIKALRFASLVLSLTPESSVQFSEKLPPHWLPLLAKFPPHTQHLFLCYVGAGYSVESASSTSHNPIHPVLWNMQKLLQHLDFTGVIDILMSLHSLSSGSLVTRLQELVWSAEPRVALGALTLALRLKGHLTDSPVTQATQIVIHTSEPKDSHGNRPEPLVISLPSPPVENPVDTVDNFDSAPVENIPKPQRQ